MQSQRSQKTDIFALLLLALVLLAGLALFSYDPADPLPKLISPVGEQLAGESLVFPANAEVANICGQWGALLATLLLKAFGLGAYYLVISIAIFDTWLLARLPIRNPIIRSFGWTLSLVGLTTIAATIAPGVSPGPVIGSGGYMGALACSALKAHFASVGGLILSTSVFLTGLLLCTDYVLFRMGWLLAAPVLNFAAKIALFPFQRKVFKKRITAVKRTTSNENESGFAENEAYDEAEAEEEEYEEEYEEEEAVPFRIRSPRGVPEEASAEEEEKEEEEKEEEEKEEEEKEEEEKEEEEEEELSDESSTSNDEESASFRTRVAQALRLKRSPEQSREEVMQELEAASLADDPGEYKLPPLDLLLKNEDYNYDQQEKDVRRIADILEKTFASFGFKVRVVEVETGPVIAQYEVQLEAGLRLSRITGLADDLAIALRVPSVRIVAPIPGKNTVGIEIPNTQRQLVRLRDIISELGEDVKRMRIPLFLGKDVSGNPLAVDLSTLPHLLIAGRTGTGKSVCLNAIISSILMTRRPDEVRMLMIDPKMVELSGYRTLPHLMHPVVTDMRKAEAILAWAVAKMEERYELLARAGVRHISIYNQLGEEELMDRLEPKSQEELDAIPRHLPFIVIVADEIADLMMTSGKEVEQHIIRLAQKSRAVGIHLILATQKPTVDVITGLIKSNLPARIAFQVASRTDSRVVLDEMGADKLLGNGDMLFLWPGTSTLLRGQGTYLSDDEIDSIVDYVSTGEQHFVNELLNMKVEKSGDSPEQAPKSRDELYNAAVDIVVREGRGSVSLLQRALGIGYGRAARLIDFMAEDGIVGTYAGSQAREVLISATDWELMRAEGSDHDSVPIVHQQTGSQKATLKLPVRTPLKPAEADIEYREDKHIDTWNEDEEEELEQEDVEEELQQEDAEYEEEEELQHEDAGYEEEEEPDILHRQDIDKNNKTARASALRPRQRRPSLPKRRVRRV